MRVGGGDGDAGQKARVDEAGVVAGKGGKPDAEAAPDRGDGWPPSAGDRLRKDDARAPPTTLADRQQAEGNTAGVDTESN